MYVDLGLENGGFPINLSEGGMAFHGVRAMRKDQPLQIKFTLPGLRTPVESAAQIVWLNQLAKGGGLQFIDMPESSARLIREWLSLQTSVRSLADTNPMARPPVEMKDLKPSPAIRPVTGGDRPARNIYSRAIAASLPSGSAAAETAKLVPAGNVPPLPVRPVELPQTSGFRSPLLKPEARSLWSVSFPFVVVTGLGLAAFLGLASYQLHWSFEIPATIPNPTALLDESVTASSPRHSSDRQRTTAPSSVPFSFASADSPAAGPANDSADAPAMAGITGDPAPYAPPAKKPVPLKMKPPRTVSRRFGASAGRMTASQMQKAPTADMAPPTLTPPVKTELAAQLPALPSEVPPPAPAPREPVAQNPVLEAAQLISRKSPVYPPAVRGAGFFGSVELHFMIGADGAVHDVTVMKGNPLLGRAATEALQSWRYKPARRDGVPVESESRMTFVFDSN